MFDTRLADEEQTSGAKIFSSHAHAPTDKPLLDTRPDLYDIQKAQRPVLDFFKKVSVPSTI